MIGLKPFWNYYGGKWRAAPRYPKPRHGTIVEPFAGAAGYSLRYADRNVILIDKYPVICEIWRFLIGSSRADILAIPCVDCIDDLPDGTPEGAKHLVGFLMNKATATPRKRLSPAMFRARDSGKMTGWDERRRKRVANQVDRIKHWRVIEGSYVDAPDIEATWFVDPPYSGQPGREYKHNKVDFPALGDWCQRQRGFVIACENAGARWLPFKPFETFATGLLGKQSVEVIWTSDDKPPGMAQKIQTMFARYGLISNP